MITGQAYYSGVDRDGVSKSWTAPGAGGETELEVVTKMLEQLQVRYNALKGPDDTSETVPGRGEDEGPQPDQGGSLSKA